MEWLKRMLGLKSKSTLNDIVEIPIMDYTDMKVYCKGYLRDPSQNEIRLHSQRPYKIFDPIEPHGWKVTFYSEAEVFMAKSFKKLTNGL